MASPPFIGLLGFLLPVQALQTGRQGISSCCARKYHSGTQCQLQGCYLLQIFAFDLPPGSVVYGDKAYNDYDIEDLLTL